MDSVRRLRAFGKGDSPAELLWSHSRDYVETHSIWLSSALLLALGAPIAGYALGGVIGLFAALVIGLLPLVVTPLVSAVRKIEAKSI